MSSAKPRLRSYVLKQDIILDTRDAEGNEKEEVLKPAGTTVFVRRPKGKDLLAMDGFGDDAPMGAMLALMKRTVKLDSIEIDNLDGEDFQALGELLSPPQRNGPPTGGTA